jgi:hypothetical protein
MQSENLPTALRRSSRVPAELPIKVTTLAGAPFSGVCKTLVVNAHGCALQSPVKFDAGIPLRFHSNDGRETTAHVVTCHPIGPDNRAWILGARLDRPENFWRLSHCPEDWVVPAAVGVHQFDMLTNTNSTGQSFETKLDVVAQRLEKPLKRLIAESLGPLEAQVAVLKETVARREANPSKFDVSLSSIPPELEKQLEERLRKELGPKVLQESRQQYADLLEAAKSTIDKRTAEGYETFVHKISEQLKVVEKRADEASANIGIKSDEQLRRGMREFQQKVLDGGNSLKRLSEELLEFLQNNLTAEYHDRLEKLEELRASVSAESSRLRKEVEGLENRIAKLDESTHSLESGLDQRLNQMAGNFIRDTRSQLENIATEVLEQLTANSVKNLENQLSEATEKMASAQKISLASCGESLERHTANALRAFEQSTHEMAQQSVEQWRLKLAGNLKNVAKKLGESLD